MKLHINDPIREPVGEMSAAEAIDELLLVLKHFDSHQILAIRDRLAENVPKYVCLRVAEDNEIGECDMEQNGWRKCYETPCCEPLFWEPNVQASFGFVAI